jgi:transcriptional regulator with XRE-family HTH domain
MGELGENLKTIRESWNKTQEQMAHTMNSNRGKIYSYENGSEPNLDFLLRIEELTGFSIRYLCTVKISRLDVSERPLHKEDGLLRLANSNVNIQLGDSNGDVVQHIGIDERALLQQTIAAQGKTISVLEKRLVELEDRLDN